jgi:hypothetical protein
MPPDPDADAERLFREGQKLLEAGRYGEACPKFEVAYRKDQQLGTLLNLAFCHKELGAVWPAWVEFKAAEVKANALHLPDRRDFALRKMAELEKSLARVVVVVPRDVELTEVLVEDRHVPEAERGVVFAAEPGDRKFSFRAKGKKAFVQLVTVVKGDQPQRLTVPPMEDELAPLAVEPSIAAPARPGLGPSSTRQRTDAMGDGSGQKTLAIVFAGLGVVGVGVGATTGIMTLTNGCTASARKEDPSGCPDDQRGRNEAAAGEMTGLISTISFAVGGASLVAAAVLYFTAPHPKSAAVGTSTRSAQSRYVWPDIGPRGAGLAGRF